MTAADPSKRSGDDRAHLERAEPEAGQVGRESDADDAVGQAPNAAREQQLARVAHGVGIVTLPTWPRPTPISIVALDGEPLSIPLREPFVIATGRIDTTRAALVRATLEGAGGRARDRARRGGRAAAGHARGSARAAGRDRRGGARAARRRHRRRRRSSSAIGRRCPSRVARAGVEAAILDARARLAGVPLYAVARAQRRGRRRPSSSPTSRCRSPIRNGWRPARGAPPRPASTCFKVKVGRDWRADLASLRAVAAAVPDARFRLDANAGFARARRARAAGRGARATA